MDGLIRGSTFGGVCPGVSTATGIPDSVNVELTVEEAQGSAKFISVGGETRVIVPPQRPSSLDAQGGASSLGVQEDRLF